ncbi:ABC transporter permease [Vampirovibrio sp.]|uniref:ABC transporter permease n=1 Tax=Vampirovibrio sp. TaxID=2717857 RepID=UPI00359361F1
MAGLFTHQLPVELYLAKRYVSANPKQSLIIMLAVGIGVALIVFIPSINLSFFQYFLDKTVQNSAHINLTRELDTMPRNQVLLKQALSAQGETGRILFSDQTSTRRRNINAYKRLLSELEKFPGILAVAPSVRDQVIVVKGSQNQAATLQGIMPALENQVNQLETDVVEGNLMAMGPNDVFLGSALAEELNAGVGDRVQLITPYGSRSYKVAGLIKSGVYQQDLTKVLQPLESAQNLLDLDNEITNVSIKITDIYQAENMARQLADLYQLKARSWMEDNKIFLDQINNFRIIIAVINFLIVFAAATSITSILIMVVASKSREIGILKAMGASPQVIMRLFIAQGIGLSIMGTMAGFVGAYGLITLYNVSPLAKGETILGIERPPTVMNLEYALLALVYALISSVLASLFPAWRASRLDPVEAINQ